MNWNPLRWAWGLVPIAMLCWMVVLTERERIETDLRARSQAALAAAGLPWAGSTFNGRDAILTGQASEDNEPDQAVQKLRETWGVRVIENRAELLEKADVYNWSATEKDNKLRLAGYVPNDATRKAILGVAKATFPKLTVEDAMKLARGAPPRDTWLGGTSFALKNLALLKSGTAELEGTNFSLSGIANDPASYKTVKTALTGSLPPGIKLKSDQVKLPVVNPYTWSAQLHQGQAVLSGHVPSEQQRTQLVNAAKSAFGRVPVTDRMELADGAPEGFAAAAAEAVRELAKLDDGQSELRGPQLNVTGMAATDVVAEAVRKSLREKLPSSVRLTEAIKFKAVAVPTIDPFRTSVEITPAGVVLTGHAPSDAAKSALSETVKARLPNWKIDNRLEIGNGAPQGWQSCMQYGLAGLGRLGNGKFSLVRNKLELRGETADEPLHKALPDEIALAAGSSCDTDVEVKLKEVPEPSLNWKAVHSATQIILEGEAPDAAAKNDIVREATKLFPGAVLVDRVRVAGVPAGHWTQMAVLGLQQMARLRTGTAEIKGQQLTVSGVAAERAVAASIHDQLSRQVAKGYSGRDEIEVRTDADISAEETRRRNEAEAKRKAEEDAKRRQEQAALDAAKKKADEAEASKRKVELDRCQDQLKSLVKSGIILFERASAELNDKSFSTLDALSKALKGCAEGVIEIEGHTDLEGEKDRNQRLSEKRAQTVRQYLIDAGVGADRLTAVGYGSEKPIAPNDTAESRAKNRRIEFTVKGR